jgi:hypothetical protein
VAQILIARDHEPPGPADAYRVDGGGVLLPPPRGLGPVVRPVDQHGIRAREGPGQRGGVIEIGLPDGDAAPGEVGRAARIAHADRDLGGGQPGQQVIDDQPAERPVGPGYQDHLVSRPVDYNRVHRPGYCPTIRGQRPVC